MFDTAQTEASRAHVLLIDPDPLSSRRLAETLRHWGHPVSFGQSAAVTEQSLIGRSDLLLLDPGGPAGQGWQRLRRLRELSRLPIIVMLAGDEVLDRVLALESGADAVIAKPVDLRELRARMLGLLARNSSPTGSSGAALQFGRWRLDASPRRLSGPGGFSAPLSLAEYRVLRAFLERPQSVLCRQELIALVRGEGGAGTLERSIDLLISRLRHKLDDDARAPRLIRTVRGIGYLFDDVSVQKPS